MGFFSYSDSSNDYDFLIGRRVRDENMKLIGMITDIVVEVSGYTTVSMAIIDDGNGEPIDVRDLQFSRS